MWWMRLLVMGEYFASGDGNIMLLKLAKTWYDSLQDSIFVDWSISNLEIASGNTILSPELQVTKIAQGGIKIAPLATVLVLELLSWMAA